MSRRLATPLVALVALLVGVEGTRGQDLVELERWEGLAKRIEHRGPGTEYFRLDARVAWSDDAPRDPSKYEARVTLPDGSTVNQEVRSPQGPGTTRQSFFVPVTNVLNVRPAALVIRASIVDRTTGATVSNELTAGIEQFPHPGRVGPDTNEGPFHWGQPLRGEPGMPRPLERKGPGGLIFLRVPASGDAPGFYIAATELTNAQARRRLPGYDPETGRSDDFQLSGPDQPALNLSPRKALELLEQLSRSDGSGIAYRLPTRDEWLRAARGGRSTAFWWGDEPTYPEGANFLGPEPALEPDTTAPARPETDPPTFAANPWGLYHTFGNVAEWASTDDGGFVRLGGSFRTEPASPLPEEAVENDTAIGPDPYVGVRPAFDLDANAVAESLQKVLMPEVGLETVSIDYNLESGMATLRGEVPSAASRRLAARKLAGSWFVNGVTDEMTLPTLGGDYLAQIGTPVGEPKRVLPLGRVHDVYTFNTKWAGRLPVAGSEWYVNVYLPGGQHYAHVLPARDVGNDTIEVVVDHSRIMEFGLPGELEMNIGLSLGRPARLPTDPAIVSNLAPLVIRVQ